VEYTWSYTHTTLRVHGSNVQGEENEGQGSVVNIAWLARTSTALPVTGQTPMAPSSMRSNYTITTFSLQRRTLASAA
jgi:hypothetical protein